MDEFRIIYRILRSLEKCGLVADHVAQYKSITEQELQNG